MDKKKLVGLLASPVALSVMFGTFAGNAAALEPKLDNTVSTGSDLFAISDTNNNDNNNNNNNIRGPGMKPGVLRQLDAELRLG